MRNRIGPEFSVHRCLMNAVEFEVSVAFLAAGYRANAVAYEVRLSPLAVF